MPSRRTFVASMLGASATLPTMRADAFRHLLRAGERAGGLPPASAADDEGYWGEIQRAFDIDRTMVNLNNGGCSPAPTHVLEQMIRDLRFSNELPVDHMWRGLDPRLQVGAPDLPPGIRGGPPGEAHTRTAARAPKTAIFGVRP